MSSVTLIVAATKANGIGQNSGLPWRLPLELAYFARVTSHAPNGLTNAVIMGRKTWESIPSKFKPLKSRINVVISRNADYNLNVHSEQTVKSTSLLSAIKQLTFAPIHRIFAIGGASIYAESLGLVQTDIGQKSNVLADRILLTRILHPTFDQCDVFLPEFRNIQNDVGQSVWSQASFEELQAWTGTDVPIGIQEEKGIQYEFQMWVRKTKT